MILASGSRLGPYEIQAPLGSGGMGEVYRARDTRLGRTVAIKVLPAYAAADADRRRRFEQEARAASTLAHPNICVLYDIGCEVPTRTADADGSSGPLHFLVMEHLEGRTLAERLRSGPLSLAQVLDVGAQIADALAAAHSRGIVHRDLKPANVMLTGSSGMPRVKLLDFGLAKLSAEVLQQFAELSTTAFREPLTSPGEFLGTLPYMAPEQLEGKEADARTDVFAFGCVLYEMLTGRRAFAGANMASVISAIMAGPPPAASTLQPVTPYALDRLISSCLAKDRAERRESAHDLAEDLRSIAASESGRGAVPSPPTPSPGPGRAGPRPRRKVPWAGLGASVLAVAAAVAAYQWTTARNHDTPLLGAVPTQLTSAAGLQGEPAISPDGGQVAFVSDAGGTPHIWVVDNRGAATLQLTSGPEPDRDPTWLPDSSAVLFASIRDGRPGIWMVQRLGGAQTLVTPDATDPAVSPDGAFLAFAREVSPSGSYRIFVAPLANTADARMVTTDADGMWDHRQPAWAPDGRWLCYRAQQSLWIVSPGRAGARRLTVDDETALDPAWSADGRSIYHTSLREGTAALWRADARTGATSRVTSGSGPERHPSLSRDGKTLAFSTELADRNLVLRDLATGREESFGTLRSDYMPAYCGPDALLFASDRVGGRDELWLQRLVDGRPSGDARRLTNHPGNVSHPACSRDGRWAAYYRVVDGQRDIWTVPTSGGPPIRFTADPAADIHPSWSNDGTRLAFASERGGQLNIWVAPAEDGRPVGQAVQVTRGKAAEMDPEWSPDDAWIVYRAEPTTREADVWVTRADGRGTPRRLTIGAGAYRIRWYRPDRLLVSGAWGRETVSLRFVDPVSGAVTTPSPAVVFGDEPDMCDFDRSPDGRFAVFTRTTRTGNIWTWNGRF